MNPVVPIFFEHRPDWSTGGCLVKHTHCNANPVRMFDSAQVEWGAANGTEPVGHVVTAVGHAGVLGGIA